MSDPVKTIYDRNEKLDAGEMADRIDAAAKPTIATFKDQAAQAADEAKVTVAALADEARAHLSDIVDQQKVAGAAHIAGVARAAQAAASNLRQTSPQLARLIQSAAESVDNVADDIRGRAVGDVVASLSDFGRRQPLAFFGGAVVAGFLLARFLKSDAPNPSVTPSNPYRAV